MRFMEIELSTRNRLATSGGNGERLSGSTARGRVLNSARVSLPRLSRGSRGHVARSHSGGHDVRTGERSDLRGGGEEVQVTR